MAGAGKNIAKAISRGVGWGRAGKAVGSRSFVYVSNTLETTKEVKLGPKIVDTFNSSFDKGVPWRVVQRAGIVSAGDETDSHDDFKPQVKAEKATQTVQDHIEQDIKDNPVMVYMKGVPDAPQCGFSAMVVRILKEYDVTYNSRNVLADPELREGIKQFSRWPTVPQVFINGEFVGGSDILINMHRTGELEKLLEQTKLKEASKGN